MSGATFATALRREDGQTLAEYSMILAVVVPAIIAGLVLMGGAIANRFMIFLGYLS
jgi:Flp pilus assembly pilin Flp